MNEQRRIVETADAVEGTSYLATVVDVDGSAYRRPGARMLIGPAGERVGSISGGCLERDLARAAPWLAREAPQVVSFDTRVDANETTPRYNLGCSGVVHVLVERITGAAHCPLNHMRAVLADETPRVIATCYAATGDGFPATGQRLAAHALAARWPATAETIARVQQTGRPVGCELTDGDASCRLLVERLDPPRPLWIFGAGDDAQPVAAMAAELGWDVTVIDARADALTKMRIPRARRLALDTIDIAGSLRPSPRVAALLMTHAFDTDVELLPWLLGTNVGYVGLLGPTMRTARLMRRLHETDRLPVPAALERLHTPVGLDLGAATPAEIALAVLAEIVALNAGRAGGRLSERSGPIHAPATCVLIDVRAPVPTPEHVPEHEPARA